MFITELIKKSLRRQCMHEKITPEQEQGYCPDCGKLIKNEWYITRCSCCGVKMKAISKNDIIMPQNHYCSNCGSKEFSVEKVNKINFVDINFAVLIKKEVSDKKKNYSTQFWQENTVETPLIGIKI